MDNIGVISYAVGAVVFLVTALVLMTGQRNRPHKTALMLASWVSALWMGATAVTTHGDKPAILSYLLEPLRDLFLLVFVVRVLSAAYTDVKESSAYFRRTVSMLSGFTLLLTTLVMYRGVSGSASTVFAGIDLLPAGFLVMAVVGLALVEQLIRNARPESRRSVKYLCIGLGAIFAYDFYLYSHALLFGGVDPLLWEARGFINAIVVPVIGVAAVRDPQWSLDIFVSRRVVFHTAALLGSGLYLLAMGVGGYFIQQYGGTWGTVAQVIFLFGAVLMLMVLLFSGQLRARLRVFINKHFFHYKFEYREEWLRFIYTLTSSEPDEKLRERTIKALAEVHECPGGALWLYREAGQYRPVANWQMSVDNNDMMVGGDSTLVHYMRDQEWIINCEEYRLSPHTYKDLQLPAWLDRVEDAWLIVPLIFHDRLSGFIVLARPQMTHSMNWEDYDLLRIMGRQSAAHLAQLDAAQALSQARQFEACSRLSAYVMHDLKNLIAQLSLVVSNAARHKNNPQFMEDAIQTVENSVDKMNRLLTQLRAARDPQENLALVDVCETLGGVVKMMSAGKPLPKLDCQATGLQIQSDQDRFGAVIGHVVRNAQDATPDDGMVIVRLFKQNDYAVIEVQDTGEGMDETFIRDRLFKPFDTTKGKSGMGIGVYETREFIRSLAGEVEVLSRVNEGTTFRLRIPISEELKNSVKSSDNSNSGRADDHRLKEIAGY
ncbi:signal transduction histidine kinase [Thiogranum longum]|uniref:histidine kinase n=2 Tax=Thiogranum longum TaxID=1537524 RepID=A0A4R1HFI2_9GAMM|nr:signal transduction histidine kinase [Thiogranum longum]